MKLVARAPVLSVPFVCSTLNHPTNPEEFFVNHNPSLIEYF